MICSYVRGLDSDNYNGSSLRPDTNFCCMVRLSNYCSFVSFSSVWRQQMDFNVRLRQAHMESSVRVLIGWPNFKDLVIRTSKRTQYNIDVDTID